MGRTLVVASIWLTIVVAVVMPIVFRSRWWLRVVAVLVLVWWSCFVWMGVVTSARLAPEIARRDGGVVNDDFNRGADVARDLAYDHMPLFGAIVAGLSLLVIIPPRARQ